MLDSPDTCKRVAHLQRLLDRRLPCANDCGHLLTVMPAIGAANGAARPASSADSTGDVLLAGSGANAQDYPLLLQSQCAFLSPTCG